MLREGGIYVSQVLPYVTQDTTHPFADMKTSISPKPPFWVQSNTCRYIYGEILYIKKWSNAFRMGILRSAPSSLLRNTEQKRVPGGAVDCVAQGILTLSRYPAVCVCSVCVDLWVYGCVFVCVCVFVCIRSCRRKTKRGICLCVRLQKEKRRFVRVCALPSHLKRCPAVNPLKPTEPPGREIGLGCC